MPASSFSQLNYADFSNLDPNDLSFVDSASIQGNKLRLINGLGYTKGAAWYNTTQPVKNGFVSMFSFQITNPQAIPGLPPETIQNGADGFAFLIHTWGTGALGNGGGQIGYASDLDNDPLGIPYSLAIEFDTYYNPQLNDPDGNHISVHNYGQYYNDADENISSIARVNSGALGINLKDGNVHNVRIEYDGTTMKVFVDDFTTPKLSFPVNFNNILLAGEEKATIGFTAGAAAESNYHEILNWSFVPAYVDPCSSLVNSPESSCQTSAPDADVLGPNPPEVAQMPDYHPGANPITGYNTGAKIDTAVLPNRPTEHWAKYYFPKNISSVSNLPLVVLLHGQHLTCGYYASGTTPPRIDNTNEYASSGDCPAGKYVAPSHKGYDYLAKKLASWGYVVASVNSNRGINNATLPYSYNSTFPDYPTDNNLIRARGRLVLRHLQRLSEWNEGTTQFVKSVDQLGANRQDYTGWVGIQITTGALPVKIKALGRMYRHGNSQTHTVKIVKVSGNTPITDVQVQSTNWNEGQFKYVNLPATPAVTLAANTAYYIISQETIGGDMWSGADSTTVDAATVTPTDAFTVNGKVKSPNGTNTWNNVAGSTNQTFGPVDFIYEVPDAAQIKSQTLGSLRNNVTGWVGMKFTTGAFSAKVKSLGRMFRTGNAQSHAMRMVRVVDNALIASATVATGGTNNNYKYANLASPVTLTPNTAYYLISQETSGGDQFSDSNTTVVPSSVGTVNGRVFSLNGTTVWDTSGAVANQTFGPVNFIYEAGSTPAELGISLKGKLDFGNVGLMGHSRGGEGVRVAYNLLRETTNNPWQNTSSSRIRSTVNVKGIFEISPTDRYIENPLNPSAASVNADGTAWATLLPACDGDLSYLPGVKVFDRMLSLTGESSAKMKATFYVYGTNHDFYNEEWQTSDSSGCIGNDNLRLFDANSVSGTNIVSLRKTGSSSFMAFFRGNVGASANPPFNQLFNPAFKIPTNISSLTKVERGYTASPNTAQTTVFNSLRQSLESLNICSGSNILCSTSNLTLMQAGAGSVQPNSRRFASIPATVINHEDNFFPARIYWFAPAPTTYFQANWAGGGTNVDASSFQTLDFRITRSRSASASNPELNHLLNTTPITNFSIQLVMNDGNRSKPVQLRDYIALKDPVGVADKLITGGTIVPVSELHPILQTVRINLTDFEYVDLTQIKAVRFIFNDTSKGAIFLSDIQLSK